MLLRPNLLQPFCRPAALYLRGCCKPNTSSITQLCNQFHTKFHKQPQGFHKQFQSLSLVRRFHYYRQDSRGTYGSEYKFYITALCIAGTTYFMAVDKGNAATAATPSSSSEGWYVWGGVRTNKDVGDAEVVEDVGDGGVNPPTVMSKYPIPPNATHIALTPGAALSFVGKDGKVYITRATDPNKVTALPFFGTKIATTTLNYIWHFGGKKVSAKFVAWTNNTLYVVSQDNQVYTVKHVNSTDCSQWDMNDEKSMLIERLPLPSNQLHQISKIVAGASHMLLLTKEGEVFSSGNNEVGQCGVGKSPDLLRCDVWAVTEKDTDIVVPTRQGGFQQVAFESMIQSGSSMKPQSIRTSPEHVEGLQRIDPQHLHGKVMDVAAGAQHSVFVTDRGSVYTCGLGSSFQLGQTELLPNSTYLRRNRYSVQYDPSIPFRDTPTQVSLPDFKGLPLKALAAAAGDTHTVIIGSIGPMKSVLVTWGEGTQGQLGHTNPLHMSYPKVLSSLQYGVEYKTAPDGTDTQHPVCAVKVACGANHTAVLLNNGTLFSFGNNRDQQCTAELKKKLVTVNNPSMLKKLASRVIITDIFAGYNSTAAFGVRR